MSNINLSPNFNSIKIFNEDGNYFNIDSSGNMNSTLNKILLSMDNNFSLNSVTNSNIKVKNGNLVLDTESGNLTLQSGNNASMIIKNTGDMELNSISDITLNSKSVKLTCEDFVLDLTNPNTSVIGNITNTANNYTISSNDIYLIAADDVIISAGLSNGLPTDVVNNNLHKIQIGLDTGIKMSNDNIIYGKENNLIFDKKFQISLDKSVNSDLLNASNGIYSNGIYLTSNYHNGWIHPEISIQNIVSDISSFNVVDDFKMSITNNNNLDIIGNKDLNINMNNNSKYKFNNNGCMSIGDQRPCNSLLDVTKSTISKNIIKDIQINLDDGIILMDYNVYTKNNKSYFVVWYTKQVDEYNNTEFKIYFKEFSSDGHPFNFILGSAVETINYTSDNVTVLPNPKLVYYLDTHEIIAVTWTQKYNNTSYGTYCKLVYRTSTLTNWTLVTSYPNSSSNIEISDSNSINLINGTEPNIEYLNNINGVIVSWSKRNSANIGSRIVYRYLTNIDIDISINSVTYDISNISELAMEWSTNTIASNFDQLNSKIKKLNVTGLTTTDVFVISWIQQAESSWVYNSNTYTLNNIHYKILEISGSDILNIVPNTDKNNVLEITYNSITSPLSNLGHTVFDYNIHVSNTNIYFSWYTRFHPKYSKFSENNTTIKKLGTNIMATVLAASDVSKIINIETDQTFDVGDIIEINDSSNPYIQKILLITNLGNNKYNITLSDDLYKIDCIKVDVSYTSNSNSTSITKYMSGINTTPIMIDILSNNYEISTTDIVLTDNQKNIMDISDNVVLISWNSKNETTNNLDIFYQFLDVNLNKMDTEKTYLTNKNILNPTCFNIQDNNDNIQFVVLYGILNSNSYELYQFNLNHPKQSIFKVGYLNSNTVKYDSLLSFSDNEIKLHGNKPNINISNSNNDISNIQFLHNNLNTSKIEVNNEKFKILVANNNLYTDNIGTTFTNKGVTNFRLIGDTTKSNIFKFTGVLGENKINNTNFIKINTSLEVIIRDLKIGDSLKFTSSLDTNNIIYYKIINLTSDEITFSPVLTSNLLGLIIVSIEHSIFTATNNNNNVSLNMDYIGNIGINNIEPKSLLDISDTNPVITLTSSTDNNFKSGINFNTNYNNITNKICKIEYSGSGNTFSSNQQLDIQWYNSNNLYDSNFRINKDGLVIGNIQTNTYPNSLLNIVGNSTTYKPQIMIQNNTYSTSSYKYFLTQMSFWNNFNELNRISSRLDVSDIANETGENASGMMEFWVSNSDGIINRRMLLNKEGKLGISNKDSNWTPSAYLHITTESTNNELLGRFESGGGIKLDFYKNTQKIGEIISQETDFSIWTGVSGTLKEGLRIDSKNNVIIGNSHQVDNTFKTSLDNNSSGVLSINKTQLLPNTGIEDTVQIYTHDHSVNDNYNSLYYKIGSKNNTQQQQQYMFAGMVASSNSSTTPNEAVPGSLFLYSNGTNSTLQICVALDSDNSPIWKTVNLT